MLSEPNGFLQKSLDELSKHILDIEATYDQLSRWYDLFKFCLESLLEEPLSDEKARERLDTLLDIHTSQMDCLTKDFEWEIKQARAALNPKPK